MSTTTNQSPSIDRVALIYCIKRATLLVGAALLEVTQWKAGFRPDQPRVPAGNPDGGQWVDEDGDADLLLVQGDPNEFPKIPKTLRQVHENEIRLRCGSQRSCSRRILPFRQTGSVAGCGSMHATASLRISTSRNSSTSCGAQRESQSWATKSIILWNKLLRGRMDSRRNGFRGGEIWCASRPIGTGRSPRGTRSGILDTVGCHHVIIFGANRGRNDTQSVLMLLDHLGC